MLGSLPPTLGGDALSGHLARRWGALLRFCAWPALVLKRDCSYISIHSSLEIAEISLPIAASGKSTSAPSHTIGPMNPDSVNRNTQRFACLLQTKEY
jgi:hypothetical protein